MEPEKENTDLAPDIGMDISAVGNSAAAFNVPDIAEMLNQPFIPTGQIAAIPLPKFCRVCGATWLADWMECGHCAVVRQSPPLAPLLPAVVESRSIKSAMALYFSLLAVCMVGFLFSMSKADKFYVIAGEEICLSIVTLVWAGLWWREILDCLKTIPSPLWFAAGFGMALVTFTIAIGIIYGMKSLTKIHDTPMSNPFIRAGLGWGAVVLAIAIQPAIIEEVAFRGIILGALRRALTPAEAVIVSALMFMILHLSAPRFPHTLAMGLASGYLRTRTKSLYPCFLLHFTHNSCASPWSGREGHSVVIEHTFVTTLDSAQALTRASTFLQSGGFRVEHQPAFQMGQEGWTDLELDPRQKIASARCHRMPPATSA